MSIARIPSTRYTKLLSLGKGGMGEAHLAVSTGSAGVRKACVLKVLHPELLREPAARKLFFHEAQIASKLDHPKIVCTYDFGEDDDGNLFLAMEYVHGQPWSRVRAQLGPMRLPLVAHVRVLRDLLDALDHAHDFVDFDDRPLHVVHRDVAPGNVMVDYGGRVKLLDFGISKSIDSRSLALGRGFKGKLPYVSPEQVAGRAVDRRADLYAVAAMLWESIARRKRCEGEAEEVLAARVRGAEPRIEDIVPSVDPELAEVCARGLAVRPSDRYSSAPEMAAALDAWLTPREADMPRRTWAPHVRAKYEDDRAKVRRILLDELGALMDAPYATGSFATMTSIFPSSPPPAIGPGTDALVSDEAATVVQVSPRTGSYAAIGSVTPFVEITPAAPVAEESGRDSLDPRPTTLSAPAPALVPPPRKSQVGWAVAAAAMVVVAIGAVVAVVRGGHVSASATAGSPQKEAARAAASTGAPTTSSTEGLAQPVQPAPIVGASASVASTVASAVQQPAGAPEAAALAPAAPHGAHGGARYVGRPVAPSSKPTAAAAAAPDPTPAHPAAPALPAARALDERDPYAEKTHK